MSSAQWLIVFIVMLLAWRWWARAKSFRVCNGFWQYGYLTNPGFGCPSASGSEAAVACDPSANMKYYLQFFATSLAVGQLDSAYQANGSAGSQKQLQLSVHNSPFVIAPLYNASQHDYFRWSFLYPSWLNYVGGDPALDHTSKNHNTMLYNAAADACWAPVVGPFPQGNPGSWGEDSNNWPPRWLAHTLVKGTTVAADFDSIYPFTWDFPDSMVPNASSSPEGQDPKNGQTVDGVPTLRLRLFLPEQRGQKSGSSGTWWTYYALSGSGYDGNDKLLGGPVNLSISWPGTSPQSPGRFWMNCYWRRDTVPNEFAGLRAMAGGASDANGCFSPNGRATSAGTCDCLAGSIGWNCIYPRPAMPDWSEL